VNEYYARRSVFKERVGSEEAQRLRGSSDYFDKAMTMELRINEKRDYQSIHLI
jgi:hypothetical protein